MQAISAIVVDRFSPARLVVVSWLSLALLVCAVAVVIGAEWPRLRERLGLESRRKRQRARRKAQWKVVRGDAEDFAASVERDLENLPTLDESDRYK
jgi:hypothetical protein